MCWHFTLQPLFFTICSSSERQTFSFLYSLVTGQRTVNRLRWTDGKILSTRTSKFYVTFIDKKIFNASLCLSIISLWLLSLKESAMKPRSNFSGEVSGNCSGVEVRFYDIPIIYNGTCFSFSVPFLVLVLSHHNMDFNTLLKFLLNHTASLLTDAVNFKQ